MSIARILTAIIPVLVLPACGERITPAEIDELSRSVADVMVNVQRGSDSTARHRIADSVSRAHGFDGWVELREEIGVIATEPEKLRTMLDSTTRRIEARTK